MHKKTAEVGSLVRACAVVFITAMRVVFFSAWAKAPPDFEVEIGTDKHPNYCHEAKRGENKKTKSSESHEKSPVRPYCPPYSVVSQEIYCISR